MNFEELLQALQGDNPPDTIYDDLLGEYNSLKDGSAAAVADRDGTIAALNDEITRLKSQNFDLIMQMPKEQDSPEPEPDEPAEDGDAGYKPEDNDDMFSYERND